MLPSYQTTLDWSIERDWTPERPRRDAFWLLMACNKGLNAPRIPKIPKIEADGYH